MPILDTVRDFARNLDFAEDEEPVVPAVEEVPQEGQPEIPQAVDEVQEVVPAVEAPAVVVPDVDNGRNLDEGYWTSSSITVDEIQAEQAIDQGANPVQGKYENFVIFSETG